MARRRGRSTIRGNNKPKRNLFWARTSHNFAVTPNNRAQPVDLLYDFQQRYDADLIGFTVTRIVGHLTHWSQGNGPGAYTYSAGIRVDDNSQWDTGDTDAYQLRQIPWHNPYSDWMWVRNSEGYQVANTATPGEVITQMHHNRFELDLRSQRRLSELSTSLYLMHGVPEELDTGASIYAYCDLNVLCKQP